MKTYNNFKRTAHCNKLENDSAFLIVFMFVEIYSVDYALTFHENQATVTFEANVNITNEHRVKTSLSLKTTKQKTHC